MADLNSGGAGRLHAVVGIVCAATVLFLAPGWLTGTDVPYMNDFIAYWTVGRLLLDGSNPYSVDAILELQRSIGSLFIDPGVVRNPPWTLPLLIPFASLDFVAGWYAWAVSQIVLVGGCSAVLWRMFGGRGRPAVAIGLTFAFPPALFVALGGQIAGILLLGITGFTWAINRRRDFVAGLFLALLTLKPHLLLPFGLGVLLWTVRERRFGPLIGATVGVVAGSLMALLLQPDVFSQYLEFARLQVPDEDLVSTPGAALRLLVGFDRFWIQWVPAAVGIGWVTAYYRRRAGSWDWREEMPLLVAVSWIVAPYGWVYDMALLVPMVLDGAVRIEAAKDVRVARRSLAAFVLAGVLVWAQHLAFGSGVVHAWVGPAVLGCWLYVRRRVESPGARTGVAAGPAVP